MRRASFLSLWQLLIISVIDTKYITPVISPVLFSRKSAVIKQVFITNPCSKSSTPRHLNLWSDLNNSFPFCNIVSKSSKSQKGGSMNKVQLIVISDIHEYCIPREAPYLVSAWCWLTWTKLIIKILFFLFDAIIYSYCYTISEASSLNSLAHLQQSYSSNLRTAIPSRMGENMLCISSRSIMSATHYSE